MFYPSSPTLRLCGIPVSRGTDATYKLLATAIAPNDAWPTDEDFIGHINLEGVFEGIDAKPFNRIARCDNSRDRSRVSREALSSTARSRNSPLRNT